MCVSCPLLAPCPPRPLRCLLHSTPLHRSARPGHITPASRSRCTQAPLSCSHGHSPHADVRIRRELASPASPSRPTIRYAAQDTRWENRRASPHPSRRVASRRPDAPLARRRCDRQRGHTDTWTSPPCPRCMPDLHPPRSFEGHATRRAESRASTTGPSTCGVRVRTRRRFHSTRAKVPWYTILTCS